jgi:hypothetical protein
MFAFRSRAFLDGVDKVVGGWRGEKEVKTIKEEIKEHHICMETAYQGEVWEENKVVKQMLKSPVGRD